MKQICIGLVGAGTVGGGVVKLLNRQSDFFREKLGLPVVLKRIVVKTTDRFATLPVGSALCSESFDDILNDNDISIVIELVGGTGFARKVILDSLGRGKHVITANKALIAEYGPEIFSAAEKAGVSVYFEAAVGGGMPVIKTVREGMVGNEIRSIKTIINGTCNYILTQMSSKGLSFETALAEAQRRGYAEADPTLDIEGGDSGHKTAILASLIHGGYVPYSALSIEGISRISHDDIRYAEDLGYCIKLLGIIKKEETEDSIDVRVHPAMLPKNHILSSVNDVFNAVALEGDAVGSLLLYGRGAGELPTASAVVSDIIDVARNSAQGIPTRVPMHYYSESNPLAVRPLDSIESRYYLRFTVIDEPGVLASIATTLGSHGISIASVMQREGSSPIHVPVIILTHVAKERSMRSALSEIERQSFVKDRTQLIRIEE